MERISRVDPDGMNEAQRRLVARIAAPPRGRVSGPFQVWLHCPEMAERIEGLGRHLRFEGALPARLRELAILVTAQAWRSSYEWHAHEPHARSAGLDEATIAAVAEGRCPHGAGTAAVAVYELCHELHRDHGVADETFSKAQKELGREGVIELVALSGYYTLVAMTLNAFRVLPADGAEAPFAE